MFCHFGADIYRNIDWGPPPQVQQCEIAILYLNGFKASYSLSPVLHLQEWETGPFSAAS